MSVGGACWFSSIFNGLLTSTFDSLACFLLAFCDCPNRIAIPKREIRALTHIAAGSDLNQHCIYNDYEQRRGTGIFLARHTIKEVCD